MAEDTGSPTRLSSARKPVGPSLRPFSQLTGSLHTFEQRPVHFQDVDEFHAGQSAQRRGRLLFQKVLDVLADNGWLSSRLLGPGFDYTVELILGILHGDVRIETGAGGGHEIDGHILFRSRSCASAP